MKIQNICYQVDCAGAIPVLGTAIAAVRFTAATIILIAATIIGAVARLTGNGHLKNQADIMWKVAVLNMVYSIPESIPVIGCIAFLAMNLKYNGTDPAPSNQNTQYKGGIQVHNKPDPKHNTWVLIQSCRINPAQPFYY